MKNKIAAYAVMILLFAVSVSHAMHFGTEFTGSLWEMDGKDYLKYIHTYKAFAVDQGYNMTGQVTQGRLGGAVGLFMEGESQFRLGVAVGYGVMPAVSGKRSATGVWNGNADVENAIIYIPLDLYLKSTFRGGKFSLFGGGGVNYVMANTDFEYNDPGYSGMGTFTQEKIVPHVQAGGEWFMFKWLSLNVSAKYLFSAVLDNLTGNVTANGADRGKNRLLMQNWSPYGEAITYQPTSNPVPAGLRPFKYDLSGLRANAALRVYFK